LNITTIQPTATADITAFMPSYWIKSYPELQQFFTRGENRLLSYLHNWVVSLARKGFAAEWITLRQQDIGQAIEYSATSVRRFIKQINEKCGAEVVQVRERQVSVYGFQIIAYDYRLDWPIIMRCIGHGYHDHNYDQNGDRTDQNGDRTDQNGDRTDQNGAHYKQSFKQSFKNTPPPSPPQVVERELEIAIANSNSNQLPEQADQTTTKQSPLLKALGEVDTRGELSAAPEKMRSDIARNAAALGLTRSRNADGTDCWIAAPAGPTGGAGAWVTQGIALGFWENRTEATDFHQALIGYARNQDWINSPLGYANDLLKKLLRGDDPMADRLWEGWRSGFSIGWENQFDWEVSPGVINPAFKCWVETDLNDSAKSQAANAETAAKAIRFSSRMLWERYQRVVQREVEQAAECDRRGQTYLPPGAILPRGNQPDTASTYAALDRLMGRRDQMLGAIAPAGRPDILEITAEEFEVANPDRAGMLEAVSQIGSFPATAQHTSAIEPPVIMGVEAKLKPEPIPDSLAREKARLLPAIGLEEARQKKLWRRRSAPYDLRLMAQYLVWEQSGITELRNEAINWLEASSFAAL
jgi:hypothetical protein